MAPGETTPLIQRVPVAAPRQRYPHQTLRRVCTWTLSLACVAVLILFFVPLPLFDHDSHFARPVLSSLLHASRVPSAWLKKPAISYEQLQKLLLETPDEKKAREWSKYYTAGPHLAGQNYSQALWTKERWEEFGIKSSIVSYDIYLNYPRDHRLALLRTKGNTTSVEYEASLEEDVLKEDGTSGLPNRIPTFHGYSASGNVTAQYVWVNYGTYRDFEDLVEAGIKLEGKIALAKYGGVFRGLKVKRAQDLGMIGCIIYSDPGDDGDITEENGYDTYPNGPARNPSSVQRGSAQFLSIAPGDPTTPGWPSIPGAPRIDPEYAIPKIPSVPISYQDALPLLKALNGHGPNVSSFNEFWQRGNGLRYKGVKYNIGPSPPELTVNLMNDQEYVTTPLWNVIGIINGTLKDEVVILGNHRDAWIAGGAGDPNSGSAALVEVIRSFGKALEAGWKPLRTIVFASWDGEEYALLGSTEWVEEYLPWLSQSAVAYLNVDVGTTGSQLITSAAPLLDGALIETTKMVQSPNQTVAGQTVYDQWDHKIRTMGSGSDFTAFQDFAGIPCTDFGFTAGSAGAAAHSGEDAIYHYHSNYDSFDWMDKFGDPGWHYHVTAAKLWSLLAVKLSESPIIPFSAENYGLALAKYTEDKKAMVKTADTEKKATYGFKQLDAAVAAFHDAAAAWDAHARTVAREIEDAKDLPWYKFWKKVQLFFKAKDVNTKYKYLERQFLYEKGLDGRSWFKHSIFAPGLWTGYAGATFPGIVESIEAGDVDSFYRWQSIVASKVRDAAHSLKL